MTTKEIADAANLSPGGYSLLREDSTDSTFLDSLDRDGLHEDGIRFLSTKLPIADGVKWALQCARELQPAAKRDAQRETLEAAEKWVQAPSDTTRWDAKNTSDRLKAEPPASIIAMAVYLSGGSVAPPGSPPADPPPLLAQKMVLISIQVSLFSDDVQHLKERNQRALAMCRKMG
jgi:hypothetical protein